MKAQQHDGTALIREVNPLGSWLRDWGGLLTIALALVMISFLSLLLFSGASAERKTLITDLVQPFLSLGMTILAFRASRQRALDGRIRRAWTILAVAFFVYFAANITWFYLEICLGQSEAVSWADAIYLSYYPIALAGLLTFPMARAGRSRLTFALDADGYGRRINGDLVFDPQTDSARRTSQHARNPHHGGLSGEQYGFAVWCSGVAPQTYRQAGEVGPWHPHGGHSV